MRDTIDMAREAGFVFDMTEPRIFVRYFPQDGFDRLVALVRADEQEKYKWDIHSCGPTCNRCACVAMREAVEAEREACAKVCESRPLGTEYNNGNACAAAIRARGNT